MGTDNESGLGQDILNRQRAQGNPGDKQPPPQDARLNAEDTLNQLDNFREKLGNAEVTKSSAERAKQSGNPNPVAPEDRKPSPGPLQTQAADLAASHIDAARSAITEQITSEARIQSDPRYARDQKVFELARTGKIGLVPPSDAEVASNVARSGLPESVADKIPKTPEEQVAQDMPRLEEAERRAAAPLTAATDAQKKEETVNKPNQEPNTFVK